MMNFREKLREWFDSEKKKGLRDVKFFPGDKADMSIEQLSEKAHSMITGDKVEVTDELA